VQLTLYDSHKNRYRSGDMVLHGVLVLAVFFCTTNKLVGFPLDKLFFFLILGTIAVSRPRDSMFTSGEFLMIMSLFTLAALSTAVNLTFSPMIFFPTLGVAFALLVRRHPRMLISALYYALALHMIFAIIFVVMAFAGVETNFVWSLREKGLPFVFAARGFTPTVQTFGTLCILWLIIYLLRRQFYPQTFMDKCLFLINTLAILITLNRSTYVFWMIIVFFRVRKLFWLIIIFLIGFVIRFWEAIIGFLGNKGSLEARSELLEGFNLSFWGSNSILVYIFGKGTNQLPPDILAKVKWDYRTDIENGYAMLLHTYGFLGLIFYISLSVFFIFQFVKMKKWAEVAILFYFFFVSPYFTQEFVSTSFYLFLSVMILIHDFYAGKYTNTYDK